MRNEGRVSLRAVLFSDVVGSTRLRVRAGDEAADRMRAAHDRITADAVRRAGGEVVKDLGDGVMAVFASMSAAIAAATELQQECDRWGRAAANESFELRIGISAGDVLPDAGDYHGIAVLEARRLEQIAAPSAIWTTATALGMTRAAENLETEAVGARALEGLPDDVEVVSVIWDPVPDVPAPLPDHFPPFAVRGWLPFAGRDHVLSTLHEAWRQAEDGNGPVVLLEGEPGVGKTRAATEFAAELDGWGVRVLGGRCDEQLPAPFRPIGEALRWYLRNRDEISPELLGNDAGEMARLAPGLGDSLPPPLDPADTDDVSARLRLIQAIESWLADGDDPRFGAGTLLVLDDLQWADPETVLTLRHLASAARSRLLIVCTFRDTDVGPNHPLTPTLADLRRLPNVSRIRLEGLDVHGVRELMTRTGGRRLDDGGLAFADDIRHRTAGNPFFVGELLRHFNEVGALVHDGDQWTSSRDLLERPVPASVREVVQRRLDRLPGSCLPILRTAAVIGHDFDAGLVADVLDLSVHEVVSGLEAASSAGLVDETEAERFAFAHAIVRESLYHDLSATRRAYMHRSTAEALERLHAGDLDAVAVELATHWTAADGPDAVPRSVDAAVAAAERALRQRAPDGAAAWFRRAAVAAAGDESLAAVRRSALVGEARARRMSGEPGYRDTALSAARESLDAGDAETTHAALTIYARFGYSVEQQADPLKLELLRAALERFDYEPVRRMELLGALAIELLLAGDMDARRELLVEIDELLPELPLDEQGAILAYGPMWNFSAYDRAALLHRTALLEAALVDHQMRHPDERPPEWVPEAKQFMVYLACFAGDRGMLDRALERLRDDVATTTDSMRIMWADVTEALVANLDGRFEDADIHTNRYIDAMQRAGAPEAMSWAGLGMFATGRERNSLEGLLEAFASFAEHSPPGGPANAGVAFMALATGDAGRASVLFERVAVDDIADDGTLAFTMPLLCEVAAAVGDDSRCRGLLHQLEHWRGIHLASGPVYCGAADRLAALLHDRLGDPVVADALFAEAVEQHEALRSPLWAARTHLDWASSLLIRGEVAAASTHLGAAGDLVSPGQLPAIEARLADLRQAAAAAID